MKKWQIGITAAFVTVLGCAVLFGCSSGSSESSDAPAEPAAAESAEPEQAAEADDAEAAADNESAKEDVVEDKAAEEEAVEEEPVEEAVEEKAAPKSHYEVTIDGYELAEDYEGKPSIIITYSWVNNSDKTISALVALSDKVFQNGVQLESTVVLDPEVDTNAAMSDVKPGYGNTYQFAYVLSDDSDVTVEVSELISFDESLLAETTFSIS